MATPSLAFENWFETTLSSGITSTTTTIGLNNLPTGSEGYLVIDPDIPNSREIIYFTSKTASEVVCPSVGAGRGQDGTTAASHDSGATVRMHIVSAHMEALQDGTALANSSITTPKIANDAVTPAKWDNPYMFRARRVSAQNMGNAAFAIVNFDTEDYDRNNNFDVTTNVGRYTAPVAGYYQFNARIAGSATSQMLIALYKNGSLYARGSHSLGNGTYGAVYSDVVQSAANDYWEIYSFGSGGALEVSTPIYFSGYLVSES